LATPEPGGKPGGPSISKEVRDLIRTMWQANPREGAPRIVGEFGKLGINFDGGDMSDLMEPRAANLSTDP
jgi:hypothetical protein